VPHAAEGILLNAARARHAWLSLPRITCNHFDMDGLVAVYAALEPEAALRHERLLRACSHLGDFREQLEPADAALCAQATLLCAWVSALERSLFYAPFRGSEALGAAKKYAHFLPRLPAALALAAACEGEETALPASCVLREHDSVLKSELKQVRSDTEALARVPEAVTLMPKLGLAVVRAPRPVHYQALFGAGRGCDVLLAVYPGNRYELEHKYYTYVQLGSRDTLPRVALEPLARALDAQETVGGVRWVANSVVDSGPQLRLEPANEKASKADRYAHPFEREVLASSIPPARFEAVVASYFRHALAGVSPRRVWSWADIHEFNAAIDWGKWALPA